MAWDFCAQPTVGQTWTLIPTANGGSSLKGMGVARMAFSTAIGQTNVVVAAVGTAPVGSAGFFQHVARNEFKCTLLSGGTTCSGGGWLNLTHVYGCPSIAHVHPDEHAIDFKIVGGKDLMYVGNDGGVYRALDGFTGLITGSCGGTNQFDDLNVSLGSLSQFVSFSQDPTNPAVFLGGTQDNGSPATKSGRNKPDVDKREAGDGGYNEINPANTNEWFTANTEVTIQRCTSGIACNANTFLQVVSNGSLGTDVGPFYTPYILDPQSNVSELLVGTCRVWRGPGAGGSYTVLSNNFETGTSTPCMGTEVNQVHGIAPGGPKNNNIGFSNVVYATTDGSGPLGGFFGGHVFATTNAGTMLMTDVTNNLGNVNSYTVSGAAIDTSDLTGQTAYVTIMGFGGPHVSKTTNAGASWTDFTGNLPDAPANTIVVDAGTNPSTGMIYVGTDIGVFSSPTSTPNWVEVGPTPSSGQAGYLPNVPVTKLRIFKSATQKILRASTYGRGIWQAPLILTPDFDISITNTPQTIFPTQAAVFNGKLSAVNGYNSAVNMSCTAGTTAPPSSCTPAPSSVTPTVGGASFTVTTGGTAGDYIFNAHAVGTDTNGITHDGSITLHVIDFNLKAPNPATVSANRPTASNATTFQVTAAGSFNQSVTLACSGLPAGANCNFSPSATMSPTSGNPVTVTLTIGTSNNTPTGTSTVTVSATTANAPEPKMQNLTLTVTALPDYILAISNPSLSTLINQIATFNGTLTATNGYSGSVH